MEKEIGRDRLWVTKLIEIECVLEKGWETRRDRDVWEREREREREKERVAN